MADYTYEPDPLVEQVHGFNHMDASFGSVDNEFAPDDASYLESIVMFGALAVVVGFLQVVLFVCWMCMRVVCGCCCWCLHKCCCKKKKDMAGSDPSAALAKKGSMLHWRRGLFFMLTLTIVIGLAGLSGDAQVSTGMDSISEAIDQMAASMTDLESIANDFSDEATGMSDEVGGIITACDDYLGDDDAAETAFAEIEEILLEMQGGLDDMADAAEEFGDMVGSTPKTLNDASDSVGDFDSYRQMATALPIALLWAVAILGFIGTCCSSPKFLRFTVFIGLIAILGCSLGLAVELSLSVLLSDMCMDPDGAIIDEVSGDAQETLTYYLTCVGENPLGDSLDTIEGVAEDMDEYVLSWGGNITSTCDITDPFGGFNVYLGQTFDSIADAGDLLDCDLIATPWRTGMHQGVCTEIVPGLITLWATTAACGELLYFSMIVAAITWRRMNNATAEEKAQKMFNKQMFRVGASAKVLSA